MATEHTSLKDRIFALAEPLCEAEGTELVMVENVSEHGRRIIRLLIDKEGGVGLDDCTRISREFSDLADVHLEIPGKYSLEVSSPGLNRPLVRERDYERFAGETVRIKSRTAIDGQKNFKGQLLGITHGQVNLKLADTDATVEIAFADVHSARLCRD